MFKEDLNLVFENAKKYCKTKYPAIYEIACNCQKVFQVALEKSFSKQHNNDNSTIQTNRQSIEPSVSNPSKKLNKTSIGSSALAALSSSVHTTSVPLKHSVKNSGQNDQNKVNSHSKQKSKSKSDNKRSESTTISVNSNEPLYEGFTITYYIYLID